ncbi:glutamine ABC transporter permease [Mycolicibacterium murale]|uniref:Glutamine ABC transporter permease n=1 Tax=Mycolicibacterium murale TaxID=182220 RepID=A0A7I9WP40_9MYCO|nr:amino acid ABC transporter permease [Mycolicibacterium murale]MCV7182577.1 amino acid ABC transporter permease [Mycolicibacterium murale]GFG59484.1 glutamine ABC transporter permease [Mycolicibacterium murale]
MGTGYTFDFSWLSSDYRLYLRAALVTLEIFAYSAVFSFALGLAVGTALTSTRPWIRTPFRIYVEIFRLTPPLLQIVTIFFLIPILTGIDISALWSGIIALSLNYAAFFAEIFRAGITSLPRGQWEAASAMGLTHLRTLRRIILPQAIRNMLPPVGSMLVSLTKDTSLVSVIGVAELLNASQSIGASTFRNIEALLVASLFYLAINLPIAMAVTWWHKKKVIDA